MTVKKAGGVSYDITRNLTQTTSGGAALNSVAKLAAKTYGATFSSGAAATASGTLNADSALALAKQTFSGIADRTYVQKTVSKGYAWYVKGTTIGIDPKTKKVVTLAEAIVLYVVPGTKGKASVTATVGRGDFASQVKAP